LISRQVARLLGISFLYTWWYLELLGSSWCYPIDIKHQTYMDFGSWYWDNKLRHFMWWLVTTIDLWL